MGLAIWAAESSVATAPWNLRGNPVGEGSGNVCTDLGHGDSESMLVKAQLAGIIFLKVADLKGVRAGSQ